MGLAVQVGREGGVRESEIAEQVPAEPGANGQYGCAAESELSQRALPSPS